MLKPKYGLEKYEATEDCRKLHNEKNRHLYCSPNIKMIKKIMTWATNTNYEAMYYAEFFSLLLLTSSQVQTFWLSIIKYLCSTLTVRHSLLHLLPRFSRWNQPKYSSTAAADGTIVPSRVKNECLLHRKTEELWQKPVPEPHCTLYIPRELSWDWTHSSQRFILFATDSYATCKK
jgi:hypothetical protein